MQGLLDLALCFQVNRTISKRKKDRVGKNKQNDFLKCKLNIGLFKKTNLFKITFWITTCV